MKRCGKCKEEKSLDCFNKNVSKKDGLQTTCNECNKKANKDWFKQNREAKIARSAEFRRVNIAWLKEYKKTLKCSRCPENHPRCLDFHHRDPSEKEQVISEAVRNFSLVRLKKEIDKCDVLCSNCHRKETFSDDV